MKRLYILLIMCLFIFSPAVLADNHEDDDDDDELELFGLEVEYLLNIASAVLAIGLFIVTVYAYKRNPNNRLKYVAIAFFLFALHGLLLGLEMFGIDYDALELVSSLLTFAILLSFFYGVVKK